MNHTATMQKLDEMKFTGFARAYREVTETSFNKEFTTDELIAHLVQAEWDDRYNRKLQRLITNARFRYQASFEEIENRSEIHLLSSPHSRSVISSAFLLGDASTL